MAKILIVEDLPADRELLRILLRYAQHQVLEAASGEEALRLVQSERPDLVIADVLMPGMNGFELVRQMRQMPSIARTPVVFYTAFFDERESRDLAQDAGVARVLVKPTEPQIILDVVDRVLASRGACQMPAVPAHFEPRLRKLLNDKLLANVSDLERTAEQLQESFQRFRLLAENASDMIFRYRLTPIALWEYVNPAAAVITGHGPADFYADPALLSGIIHPDSRRELEACFSGAEGLWEVGWIHPDGRTVWSEIRTRCIYDREGKPEVIEGIARDITSRKHLDQFKDNFDRIAAEELCPPLKKVVDALRAISKGYAATPAAGQPATSFPEEYLPVCLIEDALATAKSLAAAIDELPERYRATGRLPVARYHRRPCL